MSTCYTIRAGEVGRQDIPEEGVLVFERSHFHFSALPGDEHEDWESYTLACVAEIATVLTPWATWYCSPAYDEPENAVVKAGGFAVLDSDVIWLTTSGHAKWSVQTAFHEAYHSAETWLTGCEIQAVRKAACNGPGMPRQTPFNDYWTSGIEVRANAFAGWALSHWLLNRQPEYRWNMPDHERIWTAVYRGDIGLRAARRNRIRREMIPDVLWSRLNARSEWEALFDSGRNSVVAAGKGIAAACRWGYQQFSPASPAPAAAKANTATPSIPASRLPVATRAKPATSPPLGGKKPASRQVATSMPSPTAPLPTQAPTARRQVATTRPTSKSSAASTGARIPLPTREKGRGKVAGTR